MNYDNLRAELHAQLDVLIERSEVLSPRDGIVDLQIIYTSTLPEPLDDTTSTLTVGVELVQLTNLEWVYEEEYARTVVSTPHFPEDKEISNGSV